MNARAVLSLLSIVIAASQSGCMFQSLTPIRQLTDQVRDLNDETRWARVDLAAQRVHPEYRADFLLRHRLWGHDVQIADTEATNIQISEDDETATATVSVSWYDQRTMLVFSSVIAQTYRKTDTGYMLNGERIVSGDLRLLEDPDEVAERMGGARESEPVALNR